MSWYPHVLYYSLNGLVFLQILVVDRKPFTSLLPFISIVLSLASPWHPTFRSPRWKTGSQHQKFSMKFNCNPQNISSKYLASIIGFTLNVLVFIRILDSDLKPLASLLPFISIVLPLASPWLPIFRSQR